VDYSTTSSDTITLSSSPGFISTDIGTVLGNVTINSTTGSSYYYNTGAGVSGSTISISNIGNTYTLGNGGTSSNTIGIGPTGTISGSGIYPTFHIGIEWEDKFPDWSRVQNMCDQYPGLKIAFEKFKTVYKLVKDHYDTPEDQRPIP